MPLSVHQTAERTHGLYLTIRMTIPVSSSPQTILLTIKSYVWAEESYILHVRSWIDDGSLILHDV